MTGLWVHPEELADASSPFAYEACKTASYLLWAWSGRKYNGLRTVSETYECPCRRTSFDRFNVRPYIVGQYIEGVGFGEGGFGEGNFGGAGDWDIQIYNSLDGGCGCSGTLGGRHHRMRLRGTPVRSVEKVVLSNGTELPHDQYKIVNGNILQLSGTSQSICGITITYTYGVNVPMAGRRAARVLAQEFVQGWSGEDCSLPENVTSINRQGISIQVFNPTDLIDSGRTGIFSVDAFLAAANPAKALKRAKVFSPDMPKAYRTTAGTTTQVMKPYDFKITPGQDATWTVSIASAGLDILNSPSWHPFGQLTMWNGATLIELDNTNFSISGDTLTVTIPGSQTSGATGTSLAWDLYAVGATDQFSVIHLLSSVAYLSS